jgi:uncharacterized protein (DUF433 family)
MAIPQPICTRLPPSLIDEIDGFLFENGYGPSRGLRQIVLEWVVLNRFETLEFRGGPFGRRVAVRGGPEVWEIIFISQGLPGRHDDLFRHFGWLDRDAVLHALEYYSEFPDEIDEILLLNERIARGMRNDGAGTP